MTSGKLRTSWVTSEKNGTLSNIFGLPTFSKTRALSTFGNQPSSAKTESSVIFDNLWENRTMTLLNIFGDQIISDISANRTSSVTYRKIWENRTLLFRKSSVTGLFREVEHCLSLSNGIPWNIPPITCILLVDTLALRLAQMTHGI